ncbi:MAG: hypothetical protein AB7R89_29495 [Dehalococcoidia bacterium]
MTSQPAGGPWGQGVTERFLGSTISPTSRGFGPLPAMIIGFGYGIAGALVLIAGATAFTAALVVLMVWRGGTAMLLAERAGVPPWQRALAVVLNLVAEGAVIVSAAVWAQRHESGAGPLAVGFLALAGALLLGYARMRIRASSGSDAPDGPYGVASREVRLLVIAVGLLAGAAYWPLVVVAVLAHAAVIGHLIRLRIILKD